MGSSALFLSRKINVLHLERCFEDLFLPHCHSWALPTSHWISEGERWMATDTGEEVCSSPLN